MALTKHIPEGDFSHWESNLRDERSRTSARISPFDRPKEYPIVLYTADDEPLYRFPEKVGF